MGPCIYSRILLCYDGSLEGRTALREGALLAKACGARVFLLAVVAESPGLMIGESAFPGAVAHEQDSYRAIFNEGVDRLRKLGFDPTGRLVQGEASQEIAAFAREVRADLVVVGHLKRGAVARWWSGSTGAYLLDNIDCSLLVARHIIDDEAFNAALKTFELRSASA
jgi:nucleotide-binding universal stress UspA family protein